VKVTYYGVRGSIPCPGPATVRYGGNTPCIAVRGEANELVILDAGTGIRTLGEALGNGASGAILFSHVHWDHIQGLPFFAPLYDPTCSFRLFSASPQGVKPEEFYTAVFKKPNFPAEAGTLKGLSAAAALPNSPFHEGSIRIRHMKINHPDPACGFRLEEGSSVLVYLTDNEIDPGTPDSVSMETLADFSRGATLLVHDAMYLPEEIEAHKGWGHSTYEGAVRLATEAGAGRLALFHHAPGRTDEQLDALLDRARAFAAEMGARLEITAPREGTSELL